MTSILNKAIEAIGEMKPKSIQEDYTDGYDCGLERAIQILRSLLPAEKEQRKEDMREAYMWDKHPYEPFKSQYEKQFETLYNQKYKKG